MTDDRLPERYRPSAQPPQPAQQRSRRIAGNHPTPLRMELIRPATRLERPAARRLDDAGTAHPAVPLASRSTAPSGAGRPVQPAQPIPRIYSPAELEFAHIPDRHECWYRLSEPVRELLTERAGGILAWWAAPDDQGRTWAVVLGTKALVTATPTLNSSDTALIEASIQFSWNLLTLSNLIRPWRLWWETCLRKLKPFCKNHFWVGGRISSKAATTFEPFTPTAPSYSLAHTWLECTI